MITQNRLPGELDRFGKWLRRKGYSPRTIQAYRDGIASFLRTNPWGDTYQYQDIVQYFEKLAKTPLSRGVKKNILICLKRWYDFRMETGKRNDHPCQTFNIQGATDRSVVPTDLFSMEELEAILAQEEGYGKTPEKTRIALSLLIYQGLSTYEVANIHVTDIDLDKGTVTVRGQQKRLARVLELKPSQYGMLYDYIANRESIIKENTEILLLNQWGKATSERSISDALIPFKTLYPERELRPITMRMSVIAYWLNVRKIKIEDVQMLAGLRWVGSVERYTHPTSAEAQEILKRFHPLG